MYLAVRAIEYSIDQLRLTEHTNKDYSNPGFADLTELRMPQHWNAVFYRATQLILAEGIVTKDKPDFSKYSYMD